MIPSTLFCDNCGAANQIHASYCRYCGHPLQTIQSGSYHSTTGRLLAGILLRQRYRIITSLGTGGMGAVYQAEDTQLGNRPVAVKEMGQQNLNQQERPEAADAFRQEAVMLARLQHPNLPSIFDHFEENGRWYLVMSFIEGETLEDYLGRAQGGRLSVSEVIQISIILCTVLGYLHNQQPAIIFRDLKPSNIMRTPEEHLYLIDFGIARHFKPGQAKDTAYYGSMGYAPPEQYGKAQTTPRSDIYSLGAIMHQLLSGHDPSSTPFRFPALATLVPTIPASLTTLITQMLDLDEEQRPASVWVIKQELQRLLASAHSLPATKPGASSGTTPALARSAAPASVKLAPIPPLPAVLTKEQWLEAGNAHYQAKRYREALNDYEQAMRLDPDFPAAYKHQSFALYALKRHEEALAACEQAMSLHLNDDITLFYCKASALEALGRYEEALSVLEQAMRLDPTDTHGYYSKADILETLGRREEALEVLEQAIRLAPTDIRGYYGKADILEALDRREEALLVLEQAMPFAPNDVHGYRTTAILLEALDRNEEALIVRKQIIHLDPNDAYNYYYKGSLLEKLDRNEEALSAYEEAINFAPTDDFMYQCKAAVLTKLKRPEAALHAYEEVLRLKPDSASAYRGKGDILQQLGKQEEAEQAYAKASQCEGTL